MRDPVAAGWSSEVDATFGLYELTLDGALAGLRARPDDWPPRYRRWPGGSRG